MRSVKRWGISPITNAVADPRLLSTVRDDLIRDDARLIDDGWCGPSEIDDRMVSRANQTTSSACG